uniref:Uncharacterized protein n=1 Tax=Oryza punctata TaxID=4537 RepID=A0A0E0M2R0_ORYPU
MTNVRAAISAGHDRSNTELLMMQWRPSAHHKLFPGDTFVLILGPYLAAVLLALEEHMKFTAISNEYSYSKCVNSVDFQEYLRGLSLRTVAGKGEQEKERQAVWLPLLLLVSQQETKTWPHFGEFRGGWSHGIKSYKKEGIGGDTVGFDTGWAAKKQPLVLQHWPGGSSSKKLTLQLG